jgi:hypothetical protein
MAIRMCVPLISLKDVTRSYKLPADDEHIFSKGEKSKAFKKRLGTSVNPLDGATGRVCCSPVCNS